MLSLCAFKTSMHHNQMGTKVLDRFEKTFKRRKGNVQRKWQMHSEDRLIQSSLTQPSVTNCRLKECYTGISLSAEKTEKAPQSKRIDIKRHASKEHGSALMSLTRNQ